jgi:6-phosphogluconolactonase
VSDPPGEVRVVDDVPAAFCAALASWAPRTLALSGGGTAERCYTALREANGVEWEELTVLFGDERWVPVDDPESNEGMARRVLLDHVPVRAVHSLRGAGVDLAAAADAYDALVASLGRIDVIHLGLGPDGHTASLFPGNDSLDVDDRLVVATGDDRHPHPRLSLTFPGIARGDVAVVTAEGADKAEAWRRVQRGDDVPAAHIAAGEVVWLVDRAAAG